ncbi:MAG: hypothetical protein L0Z62_30775 [Gemmataceae bacterium]|nr:hypothetical protein [Gemmataceae bacterium]
MRKVLLTALAGILGLFLVGTAEAHDGYRGGNRGGYRQNYHRDSGRRVYRGTSYHLDFGVRFNRGYYYAGRDHHHWTRRVWDAGHRRYHYWDPYVRVYYYWDGPRGCYYPVP